MAPALHADFGAGLVRLRPPEEDALLRLRYGAQVLAELGPEDLLRLRYLARTAYEVHVVGESLPSAKLHMLASPSHAQKSES